MSKIGAYNLQLQEQANELGYGTVQEALDDGCKIEPTEVRLISPLEQKIEAEKYELKKAHEDWLEERAKVIEELTEVGAFLSAHNEAPERVDHAIEFIKRGEV